MAFFDGKMAFMNATVEIDKSGRLVVPKKVREAMHLQAGDKLEMNVEGDRMTLAPQRGGKGLYEKNGWLVWDSGVPMSVEQSLRLIDDAREERIQHLLGKQRK
jgi:AbrB family looped-hinge helix DNA binding protein